MLTGAILLLGGGSLVVYGVDRMNSWSATVKNLVGMEDNTGQIAVVFGGILSVMGLYLLLARGFRREE